MENGTELRVHDFYYHCVCSLVLCLKCGVYVVCVVWCGGVLCGVVWYLYCVVFRCLVCKRGVRSECVCVCVMCDM